MHKKSHLMTAVERRRFLKVASATTVLAGFYGLPTARAASSRRRRSRGGSIGLSLNLGLNTLDVGFYPNAPELRGCHRDAVAMAFIADKTGFEQPIVLRDDEAKYDEVKRHIRWAARELEDGDFFLFTMATHGTQLEDYSGTSENGKDDAWCLFDRIVLDDELYSWFREFDPGVRILAIIDSCHAGSANKALQLARDLETGVAKLPHMPNKQEVDIAVQRLKNHATQARGFLARPVRGDKVGDNFTLIRALPTDIAEKIARTHGESISKESKRAGGNNDREMPTALVMRASQPQEVAIDGNSNGLFTWALVNAMKKGPKADYRQLFGKVTEALRVGRAPQQPRMFTFGDEKYGDDFERESPFAV